MSGAFGERVHCEAGGERKTRAEEKDDEMLEAWKCRAKRCGNLLVRSDAERTGDLGTRHYMGAGKDRVGDAPVGGVGEKEFPCGEVGAVVLKHVF